MIDDRRHRPTVFTNACCDFGHLRNNKAQYLRKGQLLFAGTRFPSEARSPRVVRALSTRAETLLAFPCLENSLLSERG
jgi:hypothetical protein